MVRAICRTALAAVSVGAVLGLAAQPAAGNTDWTKLRTLNIAHQGGENEAPSNTMYSFARAMRLGSDMLEVDIHTSAEGELVVIHDATVDRTTNGSGRVYDMTLAEIQALDSAHNFVPGAGTTSSAPRSDYVFRGIRTGVRKPPPAFKPRDFRIPTLDEVIGAYPGVPINIEIKGAGDSDVASFLRNAEALAAYLNKLGRSEGIIVASFNDAALAHFHELAPQIDLAPAIAGVAGFKLAGVPPPPGSVAFQVPIEFNGLPVADRDFIQRAHAGGYGVHVWTINDEPTMDQLLGWGADGIMTAEPMRLERLLCARDVQRPKRPKSFGGRHCSPRASIACEVVATAARRAGVGKAKLTLKRRDDFAGRCAGRVAVKPRKGSGRTLARFNFGDQPPSEGGPKQRVVAVELPRQTKSRVQAASRPWGSFVERARLRLR